MQKFRFFLYGFLFIVIFVLACFYFVPSGKITYRYYFDKNKYFSKGFFHKFGPSERIINNKIIGDPTYFYLKTPRSFSSASLKIKYLFSPELINGNKFINIEAGVLLDKDNWRYELYPAYNNIIEEVMDNWIIDQDDGIIFAQKDKNYDNYRDFLNSNDFSSTFFYNYTPDYEFILSPDHYFMRENLITHKIRGSYSFYTYIRDGDLKINLSFSVDKQSIKQNLSVFVYYQNDLIYNQGIVSVSENQKLIELPLYLQDMPEGVYKIEIKGGDDVVTEKIVSNSSKIVFANRLWLSDLNEMITFYSNKNNFRIKILEARCLGDVKINNNYFYIDKIYQQFNLSIQGLDLNEINFNSCGFLIENSGLFSFSKDSFFNPLPNKLESSDMNKADFIIARYSPIKKNDNYYISEIELDLSQAYLDRDGYRFIIATPFLQNLSNQEYIEIKELEINMSGTNLIDKLKELFVKIKK